jgi:uncharacterized protein YecE (DUF72 family)
MAEIRMGSCSWKFESWEGLVYSAPRGIDYLEEYARQFDTVEIDQWFWSLFESDEPVLPDPRVVEEYVRAVPADFRFTVKVPNSITLTHHYQKDKKKPLRVNPHFLSSALFAGFLDRLAPMRDRLGPLMFQFEYLNRKKMPSQKQFLDKLAAFFSGIDHGPGCAVEIRNNNYLNAAYFEGLDDIGLGHVLLQGYWMPPVTEVFAKHEDFFLSQDTVVVRLHGPDRAGMEKKTKKKWNRIVEPRRDEIDDILDMVRDLHGQDVDTYLNVNNHYEGSAPLTIQAIREILGAS